MKYPNKKNCRGISIIEIVVSMVLIMLVMLVLAFVYPQGRKVTQGSDNRTKATEIAKSILEEIKTVAFDSLSAYEREGANFTIANLVTLRRNTDGNNYLALNNALDHANELQWPYHHFAVAGNVNAWADSCPFFIVNAITPQVFDNDPQRRPFFLLSAADPANNRPRSIEVTPENINTLMDNIDHPYLAVINVTVYWGERTDRFVVNRVTLTNSRSVNVY